MAGKARFELAVFRVRAEGFAAKLLPNNRAGVVGVEPTIFRVKADCDAISLHPKCVQLFVGRVGIEPTTSGVKARCAT